MIICLLLGWPGCDNNSHGVYSHKIVFVADNNWCSKQNIAIMSSFKFVICDITKSEFIGHMVKIMVAQIIPTILH